MATASSIKLSDKPSLLKLKRLKGKDGQDLNVVLKIAIGDYTYFGMLLLNDENETIVDGINNSAEVGSNREKRTEAYIKKWIIDDKGNCTYQHLADSLEEAGLGGLAKDIKALAEVEEVPEESSSASTATQAPDTLLEDGDLAEILEMLAQLNEWRKLGLKLGLLSTTLDRISADKFHKTEDCKSEMISAWLRWEDDVEKKGKPSWKVLINAIKGVNKAQAASIEAKAPWK